MLRVTATARRSSSCLRSLNSGAMMLVVACRVQRIRPIKNRPPRPSLQSLSSADDVRAKLRAERVDCFIQRAFLLRCRFLEKFALHFSLADETGGPDARQARRQQTPGDSLLE